MFKDLVGQQFGKWTIIKQAPNKPNVKGSWWFCICLCGTISQIHGSSLRRGNSTQCKKCATAAQTKAKTHGMYGTKVYKSWCCIKQRCLNPNSDNYQYYGERGITVCDRWLNSFENFHADMGDPPKGYQIDRIDNNGNYEPNNCQWLSKKDHLNKHYHSKTRMSNGRFIST